jgi:chromosome segregation ATPase
LLPIIALAIFFYVVAYIAQKEADKKKARSHSTLVQQVESYNNGDASSQLNADKIIVEERLNEVEAGVSRITDALNSQKMAFEKLHSDSFDFAKEIEKLQGQLQRVSKDYTYALNENQELRARMRKLMENLNENGQRVIKEFHIHEVDPGVPTYTSNAGPNKGTDEITKKLYDDTRIYKMQKVSNPNLDDTSEFDLSKLG